jgi:hypothetical protein
VIEQFANFNRHEFVRLSRCTFLGGSFLLGDIMERGRGVPESCRIHRAIDVNSPGLL